MALRLRLNMLPVLTIKNAGNNECADSKFSSQSCFASEFSCILFSDLSYIIFGKLGSSVQNTFSVCITSLCNSISGIVQICSKKKVPRIAARFIVALVKNTKSRWNGAVRKGPSNSVCAPILFIPPDISIATLAIKTPSPFPTFQWGSNIHSLPEPFMKSVFKPLSMYCSCLLKFFWCSWSPSHISNHNNAVHEVSR
jgi:hypothetical protein